MFKDLLLQLIKEYLDSQFNHNKLSKISLELKLNSQKKNNLSRQSSRKYPNWILQAVILGKLGLFKSQTNTEKEKWVQETLI